MALRRENEKPENWLATLLVVSWVLAAILVAYIVAMHRRQQDELDGAAVAGEAARPEFHFVQPPQTSSGDRGTLVQWQTSMPASYRITYGRADPYEHTLTSSAELRTEHTVSLEVLDLPQLYRLAVLVTNAQDEMLVEELSAGGGARTAPLVVAAEPGLKPLLEPENKGSGCAWCDFDGDGDLDVYLCGGPGKSEQKGVLLRNQGDRFENVTAQLAPRLGELWSLSASWGDYDADGWNDLFIVGPEVRLLRNSGPPSFTLTDVTQIIGFGYGGLLRSGMFTDLDNDGLPDIALMRTHYGLIVYRNLGTGNLRFEDVSTRIELGKIAESHALKSFVAFDADLDGTTDLLLNAPGIPVYTQRANLKFRRRNGRRVEKRNRIASVMPAVALGDVNNDALPDILVPPYPLPSSYAAARLLLNGGNGRFTTEKEDTLGGLRELAAASTGASLVDLNLDGRVDLLIGTQSRGLRLYLGTRSNRFVDATLSFVPQVAQNGQVTNVSVVDIDNDGRPDIFVNFYHQANVLLRNRFPHPIDKAVLAVRLRGKKGIINSRLELLDAQERRIAADQVLGSHGNGAQNPLRARFVLDPGRYTLAVRYSDGAREKHAVEVPGGKVTWVTITRK